MTYATFLRSRSHLAFAGHLGKRYDPFVANDAARLPIYDLVGKDTGKFSGGKIFDLPADISADRMGDRQALLRNFDRLRADIDATGAMAALGAYEQQAVGMLTGGRVRDALDLGKEPAATRERYGKHLWCQQALLARRLVEAGTAFVTLDLSYHAASGTWDTHGDNIPRTAGSARASARSSGSSTTSSQRSWPTSNSAGCSTAFS